MTVAKIMVLGKNGQIGWELQRSLCSLGQQVVAFDRKGADFEQPRTIMNLVLAYKPTIIINAAAYTNVDKAETEVEKAYLVNTEAVRALAEAAVTVDAWLIHYSTDYVFDGNKVGCYDETDVPNPLSVYGKSKLAGENAIRDICPKHLIIRSSWVYSVRRKNFLLSILRSAYVKDRLEIISDHIGAPTSAEFIADFTTLVVSRLLGPDNDVFVGTYHLTAQGRTTWYDYAKFVVEYAYKLNMPITLCPEQIFMLAGNSQKKLAKRPANSRLCTEKISAKFEKNIPDWRDQVMRLLEVIANSPTH